MNRNIRHDERGEGLISGLISLVFGIVITIVALRFVFGIFQFSPLSGFVGWVYDVSQPLVAPFFGLLGSELGNQAAGWQFASLLALVVYGIVGGVLIRIFSSLKV